MEPCSNWFLVLGLRIKILERELVQGRTFPENCGGVQAHLSQTRREDGRLNLTVCAKTGIPLLWE